MNHIDAVHAGLLLGTAILVALLSKRLRIPYAVGLMAAGALLALFRVDFGLVLSADLILMAFLPALIFQGAIGIDWKAARKLAPAVVIVAAGAILVTMAVTAAGLIWILGFSPSVAFLFGALIAATDPVAVLAIFSDSKVPERIRLMLEGESLINDGLGATLFILMLGWSEGHAAGPGMASWTIAKSIVGGVGCGAAGAVLAHIVAGRTRDDIIEIAISIFAAYGSYMLADSFGASGILAALTAGLMLCNFTLAPGITSEGKEALASFWRFAAFVANTLIFLLIGAGEANLFEVELFDEALIAFGLVLAGRAAAIYCAARVLPPVKRALRGGGQHVAVWGGLRGAMPLALALSIPPSEPYRDMLLTITFGVVAMSMLGQALTLPLLLRRIDFGSDEPA